jgi:hypothetical protein
VDQTIHLGTEKEESKSCCGMLDWFLGKVLDIMTAEEEGTKLIVGLWSCI